MDVELAIALRCGRLFCGNGQGWLCVAGSASRGVCVSCGNGQDCLFTKGTMGAVGGIWSSPVAGEQPGSRLLFSLTGPAVSAQVASVSGRSSCGLLHIISTRAWRAFSKRPLSARCRILNCNNTTQDLPFVPARLWFVGHMLGSQMAATHTHVGTVRVHPTIV